MYQLSRYLSITIHGSLWRNSDAIFSDVPECFKPLKRFWRQILRLSKKTSLLLLKHFCPGGSGLIQDNHSEGIRCHWTCEGVWKWLGSFAMAVAVTTSQLKRKHLHNHHQKHKMREYFLKGDGAQRLNVKKRWSFSGGPTSYHNTSL